MSSEQPESAAGSRCPRCAEPLEPGDRFCGFCGRGVSPDGTGQEDHPTVVMQSPGAVGAVPGAPAGAVRWPTAPEVDSADTPAPVHLATDLPGTTSGGGELPPGEPASDGTGPRYRTDDPSESAVGMGDYPLPAPDPRARPAGEAPGAPEVARAAPGARAGADAPTGEDPGHEPASARPPAGTGAGPRTCVFCGVGRVALDDYCEHCGKAQPRERDHMETSLDTLAAVSDRGLRHHRNEDAYAVSPAALPDGSPAVVAIVCDGVSSASRPDEASLAASRAASARVLDLLARGTHPQAAMHEAILAASEAVNALAGDGGPDHEHAAHQNAPACTLVGAIVAKDLLIIGWVGDSRAYWVPIDRTGPSARLTEDDSWAAQMVAAGLMSEAEAYADERAHAITGWLGADAYELEPHTVSFKPDRPGIVVVCTDGLWNYAESADEMAAVLPVDAADRTLQAARTLVGHALDGGGHDNVTVALVPFPVPGQGAGSAWGGTADEAATGGP
ncbi:protein phosphatase 2C domain-containing protein [Streptomyces uncialis]